MFKSIVIGTDGSTYAEHAVRAAAALADQEAGAVIHVVSVHWPLANRDRRDLEAQLPEEFSDLPFSRHVDALYAARLILENLEIEADYNDVSGDPTDAILDAVERFDADLVVVGSRAETWAKRAFHGSVATKTVHNAPCSIMVVRDLS